MLNPIFPNHRQLAFVTIAKAEHVLLIFGMINKNEKRNSCL